MSGFVHLHNHTHYSVLDALPTVSELITEAVNDRQPAIALTDHGVMYGIIEFYKEIQKINADFANKNIDYQIKPIIGMEAYISNGSRLDKSSGKADTKRKNYYHLLLLAKNEVGYKNLIKLTSIGHLEGFYYRPRIDKEVLEKYHEGIICTSACMGGVINSHLIRGDYDQARREAIYYKELFGDDFYIELQWHNYKEDEIIFKEAPKLARELDIKIVATNDIHYIKKEHAIAHNILLNIRDASGSIETEYKNLRYHTPEFYFKTSKEMIEIFKEFPESIQSTLEIAEKCNCTLDLNTLYMPEFPVPQESNATTKDEYLRELVYKGLGEKYEVITDEIRERADFELGVISRMQFPGYFLIVWDFIRAAKERNVRVGPGRGSSAGSIIAYALDITNIEPLKYNLLFERFLNPDRISMPDIDIDFADDKRHKVIEYVKEKYSTDAVAQIITFSKLSSRAVINDVGRVLSIPLQTIRTITSKIPVVLGKVLSVGEAMKLPDLKWLSEAEDPKIKELIEYAEILENRIRGVSIHAAGMVITPGEITDFVPVVPPTKGEDATIDVVTQYSMNELESAGLVKMDFLGLKTLSIIENTLTMIRENHGNEIDLDKIDFDDKETYEQLSEGNTLAVFQFESEGMQEYLRKLKPQNLEELTAMNALYRPGPMENIPEFIERKHGRKPITYLHPLMEQSLKTTYGIIVYQEQVMQLVQHLAGFTPGEADSLRKAMGKKIVEVMNKMEPKFIVGAAEKGISEKLAIEIYDMISEFAKYGFNKSHSLAYSYLAFQTAWLKTHYPSEFLASNMTNEINDLNKIVPLIDEAKKYGISILPPNINRSKTNFIARGKEIFFGMAGIKQVGIQAVDNIVQVRETGDFVSFFDFVSRTDTRLINRKTLEGLICAGAFDLLHNNKRAALFDAIDSALEYSKFVNNTTSAGMDSLFFGEVASAPAEPKIPEVAEWNEKTRLEKEKNYLNFYVSGHPLNQFEVQIKSLNTFNFADFDSPVIGSDVLVVGLISDIRTRLDKKNNTIAFLTIEDFTGKARIILWSDVYQKCQSAIKSDEPIVIIGKSSLNSEGLEIVADDAFLMNQAFGKLFDGFKIWINVENVKESDIDKLYNELERDTSETKIYFYVRNDNFKRNYVALKANISINPKNLNLICDIFGKNNVRLIPTEFFVQKDKKKNGWNKFNK